MTNPKPELRPVLSEVVRVIAANGASRAGGLALDGSQIGAVAGKVGARECACSKPRHPAITDVATTERTSVCCYQPNWRQLRRGSRHRGCRIATAILGSVESFYLRICPDLTGASWQRGPEAGQAGFADACPRIFTHPFCAYRSLSGFTGHRCYFSSHCYTHKYSRGTATQTNTNPLHIHPCMASPQRVHSIPSSSKDPSGTQCLVMRGCKVEVLRG